MRTPRSGDFASAAMVRVLAQGMRALGMQPPALPGPLDEATVPLDLKRAVVQSALEQGGLACLPLLGRGLHDLAMEPTHLALTAGRSAAALWVRWQRLERYIHSRHRIRVASLTHRDARICHAHRDDGPPPLPVEDLVVCGVLCALLEANGLQAIRADAAGVTLYPDPAPGDVARCVRSGQTGTWRFSWQGRHEAPSALDLSVSWSQVAPPLWSQWACAVGNVVARRLPQVVPLDDAAAELGMSRRSFQRALATEGLRYSQLQAEVRFRLAGWHLLHADLPIAEIGFVCGYADQAHLTREFKRRVGVTPARYQGMFSCA